jgi:DNA-binding NarL/FixJ family response regulator
MPAILPTDSEPGALPYCGVLAAFDQQRPDEGVLVTIPSGSPAARDIRVLLVDDHPLVRTTLAEILDEEADLTVVGECEDGTEVVAATEQLRPDVVCMDVSMRQMNGLEAAEALREARSDVRIVVYTSGPTAAPEVAAAGADALVPKTTRPDALLRCLRAVATGASGCPYCL